MHDRPDTYLDGVIQITSRKQLVMSPNSNPLQKVVLLSCGPEWDHDKGQWIYSLIDDYLYNQEPSKLVELRVWGQCYPDEASPCSTFLVELAAIAN